MPARRAVASRELTAPSSHSAAEHSSVAVSSASSFTSALTRCRRRQCRGWRVRARGGSQLTQPLQRHLPELRRGHRRQAGAKDAAVGALAQARIADHDHAAILLAADQASHALLEREHRLGQLVVPERVGPSVLRCSMRARTTGSSGEANGSLSMITRRSAGPCTSTPFPEARGAEQHRAAAGAKAPQQLLARRGALHQQRQVIGQLPAEPLRRMAQRAVTGEQQEGAAAARPRSAAARCRRPHRRNPGSRFGQAARQIQQRLLANNRTGCRGAAPPRRQARDGWRSD